MSGICEKCGGPDHYPAPHYSRREARRIAHTCGPARKAFLAAAAYEAAHAVANAYDAAALAVADATLLAAEAACPACKEASA